MAVIQGPDSAAIAVVELEGRALRTVTVPRGVGFVASGLTGTIAAALGANSSVFALRLSASSPVRAFVDRITLQFSTIVAFTTPVTAGRRLAVYRGAGTAAPSGGTAIAAAPQKHSASAQSYCNAAMGGDIRVAATAGLTMTGVTLESNPVAAMDLVHVGAAGGFRDMVFDFSADKHELVLEPGQVLAIVNPNAMDAAGTWQLTAGVQWREAGTLDDLA